MSGTAEAKEAMASDRKSGTYVVLKEITDSGELMEILGQGDKAVYVLYNASVAAREGGSAVKAAAIGDHSVDEGTYVAVPSGSFKPRNVKQVVQVSLD